MLLMTAAMFRPQRRPISTIFRASTSAEAMSFMKAPLPTVTSSTMECAPAASFFDMMLETMSGMASTVAVTSRRA